MDTQLRNWIYKLRAKDVWREKHRKSDEIYSNLQIVIEKRALLMDSLAIPGVNRDLLINCAISALNMIIKLRHN